jgi:hypothetical protein
MTSAALSKIMAGISGDRFMETTLVEQIAAKAALLPLEQQRLALQLIESLGKSRRVSNGSLTSRHLRLKGATAGAGPKLTLEAMKEARKERWQSTAERCES